MDGGGAGGVGGARDNWVRLREEGCVEVEVMVVVVVVGWRSDLIHGEGCCGCGGGVVLGPSEEWFTVVRKGEGE